MDQYEKLKEIENRISKIIYIVFPFSILTIKYEYSINAFSVVFMLFYKGETINNKYIIPKLELFNEDEYVEYISNELSKRMVKEINEKILVLESEKK